MSGSRIRVLCVDDNALVAEAIERKLQFEPDLQWLGNLPSADELATVARERRPDVVVLDIDMPGKDPFRALEEVSREYPPARVVVFSGHVRSDLINRACDAGAWGYVSKNSGTDMLVNSIRRVLNGEFVFSPDVQAEQYCG
jgi:DNA-binding NarL/FixJ family response regulator